GLAQRPRRGRRARRPARVAAREPRPHRAARSARRDRPRSARDRARRSQGARPHREPGPRRAAVDAGRSRRNVREHGPGRRGVSSADAVVVGAGIAGLACATELARRGREVLVLEAAARAGGPAETLRSGAYLLERGPNTVRANPALLALIAHAGLTPVEARRAPPAFVSDGKVVVLPPGMGALLAGDV